MQLVGLNSPELLRVIVKVVIERLLEEWLNRPLENTYPVLYVDAQYHKVRQGGKAK